MPWKIIKKSKEILVMFDQLGSFITQKEAIEEAKKIAREFKLVVRVYSENSQKLNEELMTIDYTSFFNSREMIERTISELKLAKAEKNVAKLELELRIKELKKNKNDNEKFILKEKMKNSKMRLKKAELKLKAARKRFKLVNLAS